MQVMDFNYNNFVDEFCKFSKEVFAGDDERRKKELKQIMKNLMTSKTTSIKRPIEVSDIVSEAKRMKLIASKLPNEIWMKIMSYLKNKDIFGSFALVNRHFHDLTLDPCAVKHLDLKDNKNKAKFKARYKQTLKVVKRSKTLIGLNITNEHYCKADWNELVIETLKNNQSLNSLQLTKKFGSDGMHLSANIANSLRLAKNLQYLKCDGIEFDTYILDAICNLKSLKRVILHQTHQTNVSSTQITPKFVESLAFSNNPVEYLSMYKFWESGNRTERAKALNILFEKKRHTLKRIFDNFGFCSHDHFQWSIARIARYNVSHEHCQAFPNFSECKNLEEFCGLLHLQDLALISDLPKLKSLIVKCPDKIVDDVNFLKQFQHMNFSNLKYLELKFVDTNDYDGIFIELTKTQFPLLVSLSVSVSLNRNRENDDKLLTETTVEDFIKNTPNLKSIQLCYYTSREIKENFVLKILKEANVIIFLHNFYRTTKEIKMFEKKAGPFLFEKFQRMHSDYCEFLMNHIYPLYNGK